MLKRLGWIWCRFWLKKKLPESSHLALKNTQLTTGEAEWLGRVFSERQGGTLEISCGGKIMIQKQASSTSPMRGVASCSCLSSFSRGMALTTDGMKFVKCPVLLGIMGVIVAVNEKETTNGKR